MREITINNTKYKYNVVANDLRKVRASKNIECVLQLQVFKDEKQLEWKDLKDSYASEVIARDLYSIVNMITDERIER